MKKLAVAVLLLASFGPGQTFASRPGRTFSHSNKSATAPSFYRTELYLGRSIPAGGMVSDEDWEEFLAAVVTPRFKSGFTVIDGRGQYLQKDNTIAKEPTKVLIFLYSHRELTASRRKIEEIRRSYVKRFRQESVMRLDFPSPVRVYF